MADIPEIVTQGTGTFEQLGDQAELDVSFSAVAPTRSAAVGQLGALVSVLDEPLVAEAVRSRQLWVHNEYEDRGKLGNKIVGCRAGQNVHLLVRDLGRLEELLGVLVAAEPTSIDGPRWGLRDNAAGLREAQQRAVADARQRAEGYAEALGGRLGTLRRLSDGQHGHLESGSAHYAKALAFDGGAPDIRQLGLEPEPVTVRATCTTTWELLS